MMRKITLMFMLLAIHGCSRCSSEKDVKPDSALELPPPVEMATPGVGSTKPDSPEASMDAAPSIEEGEDGETPVKSK